MRKTLLLAALTLALPCLAGDELNPEKAAQIDRDTQKALREVDKKYGDKKPSELSRDERRQVIEERAAAERGVLDKHNVDPKAYTSYTVRQSREEREATKQAGVALEAKEKAAQAAEAKLKADAAAPKEITIQRGGAGKEPIILEETAGAEPMIDEGLPQDAVDDQAAAGRSEPASPPNPPTPAKPKGKAKGKGKSRGR